MDTGYVPADRSNWVHILGSINMDIVVTAQYHPRVGETVRGNDLQYYPGGKGANTAIAAARLGAHARLHGCVGDDDFGRTLTTFLQDNNVDVSGVRAVEATTGCALITVTPHDNTIAVVGGANMTLHPSDIDLDSFTHGDIVLAQLEVPVETVLAAFVHARSVGAITMLNPSPVQTLPTELLRNTDVLVVNEVELDELASSIGGIHDQVRSLFAHDDQTIIVTSGAHGCIAMHGETVVELAGHEATVVDTTGAGDCFVGVLASQFALGRPLESALQVANIAASMSVESKGASPSMPLLEEVAVVLSFDE